MKIWVVQQNPVVGAIAYNTDRIIERLDHARDKGYDIVVFSELIMCGYPPEDLVFHHMFIESMEFH